MSVDGRPADIILTAQHRAENLMKVPVSVTLTLCLRVGGGGVKDPRSVTKFAPSLQAGQDNRFSIRCIGTAIFAESVAQVIDDAVLGSRYSKGCLLYCKNGSNALRAVSIEVDSGQGINANKHTYMQR